MSSGFGGLSGSIEAQMRAQMGAQTGLLSQTIRVKVESHRDRLQIRLERANRLLELLDKNAELEGLIGDVELY